MVVDARTGAVLHEKNADQPRPAASTQKLLTALIIAETGYLDRPVRVEPMRVVWPAIAPAVSKRSLIE